uniref:hypothetical protein n=1 Tax=Salmonella sp. SAL4433 TaxID=3159888 RepID=UPI003978507E
PCVLCACLFAPNLVASSIAAATDIFTPESVNIYAAARLLRLRPGIPGPAMVNQFLTAFGHECLK